MTNLPRRRPAETATPVVMALAFLIAKLFGVEDVDTVGYIAIAVSFVPAAVTWCVELARK